MSDHWGNRFQVQIFGESHGPGIGAVIDGMEPGILLDIDQIRAEMQRRAPGGKLATSRKEADEVEIISGVKESMEGGRPVLRTTGTSILGLIRNTNTRSQDYEATRSLLRPSHADFTGHVKYKGFEDFRGGGHFSARITAGLVFAGAVAKQALCTHIPYQVGSHIVRVGEVAEPGFRLEDCTEETLRTLNVQRVPVLTQGNAEKMEALIEQARLDQDSIGGAVETAIIGLPAGLGDPFFDSLESRIAHLAFSIPALKGISFGDGFDLAGASGSQVNDSFCIENGEIRTKTNHNGGILGGITTGMPVVFKTVFKPTASIAKAQRTVNLDTMEEAELRIVGRHDPCIAIRAIPILEAISAIAVYDAYKELFYE